jgi:hypothetical protein
MNQPEKKEAAVVFISGSRECMETLEQLEEEATIHFSYKLPPIVLSGIYKERLPLLTKLYQTQPDNFQAILQLIGSSLPTTADNRLFELGLEIGATATMDRSVSPGTDVIFTLDQFPEEYSDGQKTEKIREKAGEIFVEKFRNYINTIGSLCGLGQSIMRSLFEQQGVTRSDLQDLSELLRSNPPFKFFQIHGPIEEASDFLPGISQITTNYVAADQIFEAMDFQTLPACTANELKNLILYTGERDRLRRCVECEAIYLQTEGKSYQRFCSVRCGNRERAREYQRRKLHVDSS